jgi:hypothetical protein
VGTGGQAALDAHPSPDGVGPADQPILALVTGSSSSARFEVILAGGGVAALECALALRDLAGDRVETKLLERSLQLFASLHVYYIK